MDFYRLSLILTQLNMKFAIVLALIAFASASPATYDFTEEKTVKCNVCKYVMSEVEEYITADSTEETVLAKLMEVCDKLSSVSDLLVKGCKVIVTQVIKPELEDIITNRPTPQAACENLRLC
nr:proactivator polypeptide-like 1 [Lepeophtheirus salmonis]